MKQACREHFVFFVYDERSQSSVVLQHAMLLWSHIFHCFMEVKDHTQSFFFLEQQKTFLFSRAAVNSPTKVKTLNQIWHLIKFHRLQIVPVFQPTWRYVPFTASGQAARTEGL